MKGLLLLLPIVLIAVALVCAPAFASTNYQDCQQVIAAVAAESPVSEQARVQDGADPGSRSGVFVFGDVTNSENQYACRPFRWIGNGVKKLLCFRARC